jgi:CMP-N,N'-diacetyllegionaminic acid synthase
MNIAIIPARGGSKRLPGKNIKLLAGKPLIAWTIDAALDSKVFDHVFVSTDCDEIAQISKSFGAEVPFLRPAELATDEATTNDVIAHLVEWFEKEYDKDVTTVAILQPTSPLRNAQHIQEAFEVMKDKHAKAVISVCELEYPIQFCNKLADDGSMNGFIKKSDMKRTQDLEPYYRLNGAIYFFSRDYVNKLSELYSEGTYSYQMSSRSSVDIDTEGDFSLAEYYI